MICLVRLWQRVKLEDHRGPRRLLSSDGAFGTVLRFSLSRWTSPAEGMDSEGEGWVQAATRAPASPSLLTEP